ncbi:hypothetical protein AB1Y20_003227 [Prymnesium parvum]|uniref:Uncharacterized protein n=1 Tax=Prymnesium parvum TaxID=97485 RepID=A0AB34JCP2_PRYPA
MASPPRRPTPHPAPHPPLDDAPLEALLLEHARAIRPAGELLEEPSASPGGGASPRGIRRAAAAGHAWLSRVACPSHADKLVQPALLASVRSPAITYVPAVPRRIGKTGALSAVQLEALLYAGQCHALPLRPSGSRNGFLLADGAGVGKGRTQAAIILDAWLQGHQKALWVSASADLYADARRDLEAVSCSMAGMPPLHTMLLPLAQLPVGAPIAAPQGILYASYALLARPARLAQVIAWCQARKAFEGVLALDESHRAKAAGSTGAGAAVLRLQAELPLARVVYASATSATELHNMQYLIRLGLWGAGTPFPSFATFRDEMQAGGSAAKELLPLHLKMCGALVSRLLSYDGVHVRVAVHKLSQAQRDVYNASASLWQQLAAVLIARSHELPPTSGSRFWSAHQRFFRSLVTASKLPTLHEVLDRALAEGKSVVVGLLGTGEAYGSNDCGEGGSTLPPAPSSILRTVVTSVLYPESDPTSEVVRQWLRRIDALALPSNPLDDIMATLALKGAGAVELSGRPEVAQQRNSARDSFQSGAASVAVISDAASTGVSLHAPRVEEGATVRPRLHITLELNWSADRQIQQLGRTHRTGQACPPEHVLLVSDICGETRFVSTVARRLQSLGALSGDGGSGGTRVAEGRWGDVLESLETAQGSIALMQLFSSLGFAVYNAESEAADRRRARRALGRFLEREVPAAPGGNRSNPHVEAHAEGEVEMEAEGAAEEEEEEEEEGAGEEEERESDGDEETPRACLSPEEAEAERTVAKARLRRAVCELLPDFAGSDGRGLPRNKASSVTLFLNRLLGISLDEQALLLRFFKFLLRRAVRRAQRCGLLDGGVQPLPHPVVLRAVRTLSHGGADAHTCPQMVLELSSCADGCVPFESLAAAGDGRVEGFYAPLHCGGEVVFARAHADDEGLACLLRADGVELPPIAKSALLGSYARLDAEAAATRWRRALAATVRLDEPTFFLVCGPTLHLLPLFNRITPARMAVRRATLISGHTAVGFMLSKAQLDELLQGAPPTIVSAEEEVVSESQQKWSQLLEESLATQRELQSKLPPFDDHKAWEQCWATIRKHEAEELEPEELQEQQRRQADLRDFQSQMLKRKKEQARLSHLKAKAGALPGVALPPSLASSAAAEPTPPPPPHVPSASHRPHLPPAVAPLVDKREAPPPPPLAAPRLALSSPVEPMDTATTPPSRAPPPRLPAAASSAAAATPKRATFRPAVSAARTSAAAQRAAAQSKLHPLLQKTSDQPPPSLLP